MRFSILSTKVFSTLFAMLFVVLSTGNIFAQSGTTGVSGTVSDQNGAAVPGASVKLSNPETGFTRTVTTDEDGKFNFPTIQPATYSLEIKAANFKTVVKTNIQALVDSPYVMTVSLEPGDVSAVVDVTANSIESVINTQDATIGNNFVPDQITQLPTDLRRVNDLLSLQPGVTREGYVAGGRSDQANITLDGVDINDQQNGGRTEQFSTSQGSVLRATTESVEEFRITTVNANANQGRSSGAQISLITKTGTNNFRGSAFYFLRPTKFSANNFFNNAAGIERPSITRHIFGGSIGGPVIKDKLFFFYSYEGQRQTVGTPVTQTVPLASMGRGELKFFGAAPGDPAGTNRLITLNTAQLNSIYSMVGINPAAVAVFAGAASRYAANDTSVGDGLNTGGFRFNAPTTDSENTHIARFDYNLNDKQSLFFRGNYQVDLSTDASAFPDTLSTTFWDHPYGFVAGHNWTISNNMVNNFRYGFTRQSFTDQGDSTQSAISFRFVYSPVNFSRSLTRITPTHNFTDDLTWIKGAHTIQMGTNIRIIRNKRVTFASAYDDAVTNPSFYDFSGDVVNGEIEGAGYIINESSLSSLQAAATALIGRFSQYSGNFTFDLNGNILAAGTPSERTFATEEYDFYGQDIWKPFQNLTLTLGLRYGVSRPVYEKNGYQVVPDTRLGDIFDRRIAAAKTGIPNNDLVQFELAGPANNGQGFYSMDWNNFQPRIAAAWSPDFGEGFWGKLLGKKNKVTLRGGFAITNDHFGQQLAVSFDGLSSIGFTSSSAIAANTYNVTDNPAPLFIGFNQNIRALPGIPAPVQRFDTPADEAERIETSLDGNIKSPTHYTWNVSYGRELPKGIYFEAAYIGRKARNLLATRDVLAFNNIVDPISGMDWYTAAGILHDLRARNTPIDQVPVIPFFANLFPNYTTTINGVPLNSTQRVYRRIARRGLPGPVGGGLNTLDWTFVQTLIDDAGIYPNMFVHPQYAAFSAYSSIANSDYNGATFTLRQRLGKILTYDLNYTLSNSKDDASGLQTGGSYASQFILNPLRQRDNYSYSDFDIRHVLNGNFIFELPVGKGRKYFGDMGAFSNAVFGGWQIAGIFRWNSGLPFSVPFDAAQWATNWNVQSNGTRVRAVEAANSRNTQNVFADPQAAYNSFRNARPGETGERNTLRLPGYSTIDLGLSKSFDMPWSETHKFQFRFEVFNVANNQPFLDGGQSRQTWGLQQDSDVSTSVAPDTFGKIFTGIQGRPRSVQFAFRYSF